MWTVFLFVQIVFQIFVPICLITLLHVHLSRSPDVCWRGAGQDGTFPFLHKPHAEVHFPAAPWGLPSGPGPNPRHWLHLSASASQDMCSAPGLVSACELQPFLVLSCGP